MSPVLRGSQGLDSDTSPCRNLFQCPGLWLCFTSLLGKLCQVYTIQWFCIHLADGSKYLISSDLFEAVTLTAQLRHNKDLVPTANNFNQMISLKSYDTRNEHKDQTAKVKSLPIFTKPRWGWQVCCHAPDARHWDGGRSWNLGTQSNYSPQMRKTLNGQVSTLMIGNINVRRI